MKTRKIVCLPVLVTSCGTSYVTGKAVDIPCEPHYTRCLCILMTGYGSPFSKFVGLVAEARKDFPNLKDEDIEVVQFGGSHHKRFWGIEFSFAKADNLNIPTTYEVFHQNVMSTLVPHI